MRPDRTVTTCRACRDLPVTDSFLCQPCADKLHGHLHEAPELSRQLGIETRRDAQHGHNPPSHTPTTDQPMPINLAASRAHDKLRFELVTACLAVALGQRDLLPPDTIGGMAGWLIEHETAIGLREEAGDIARGLEAAIRRGWRVVDNPPERIYIGLCDCTDEKGERPKLYARAGEQWHQCRACETVHDTQAKWQGLQDEMADYGLTRGELKTLLPGLPAKTLDNWIDRDPQRLQQLGTTADGEPTYRYGDVLALDARRREYGTRSKAS